MIKTKKGGLVSAIKSKVHLQLSKERPSSEDQNYESYKNTAIDYRKHTSFYDPQVSIISDSQDQPQNQQQIEQEQEVTNANQQDDAQEAYDDQLMNQIQREIVGQTYQPETSETAPTIGKTLRSSKVVDTIQPQLPIKKLVPRISVLRNKSIQNHSKVDQIQSPSIKEVRFDPNPVNLFQNQTAQEIEDERPRLAIGKRQQKQILIQDQNEYQDYNPQPVKKINNQNSLKEIKFKKFKIKVQLLRSNIQISKIIKVLVKKGSTSDLKFLVELQDNNRMILPLKQLKTFYKDHLVDFLQQKAGYVQQI